MKEIAMTASPAPELIAKYRAAAAELLGGGVCWFGASELLEAADALEASERHVMELRAALTDLHIHVTDAVRVALAKQEKP